MSRPTGPGTETGFLAGGGGMGERIRAFDWSRHPLGPPASWPQSLRSALSICLNTAFPIAIYWGPDAVLLYNDAWAPILGNKHPWALGRSGREVWSEIWSVVGPVFDRVMATGEGSFQSDALLAMHRHGYTEECYFDYTFSPIRGEAGGVEGVFNAVTETTLRVVEKRRLRTLRDLAARPRGVQDVAHTVDRIMATLGENPVDLPFALLYVVGDGGTAATLVGATAGVPAHLREGTCALGGGDRGGVWPIAEAVQTRAAVTMETRGVPGLPGGYWGQPPDCALVQPVAAAGPEHPAAVLVAGVNPRRALDEEHRTFFALAASHIAAALADARAYEEEKRRAESLAALDRAKTSFFSNVSHELRTPLTLMIGPLRDALASTHGVLPPEVAADLAAAHRNAQRLLKLVNALLDFSRIEAGRIEACYEPTDLAAFTAELASSFRSAVERAGMCLAVECALLPEPVYVDRAMWEKVVLNLLSNAFKYTLRGGIRVVVRPSERGAVLTVADTGIGIPADAMPRLFERFYRVEGSHGRTHEGTGIGLALVNDLVNLHGGSVTVESEVGRGSTFTVDIPFGVAHLPKDRVHGPRSGTSASAHSLSYADEALSWIDEDRAPEHDAEPRRELPSLVPGEGAATVVLADDNRDMRAYLGRLLSSRYRVIPVADGVEALAAARRERPDLVLTDVMMPRLDGFGLLTALRADPELAGVPVVMLSARAGEESRVEGLDAGADDYLVKPFSARELLARVDAHMKLSRLRREAAEALRGSERRFREIINALPAAVYTTDAAGRITHFNPAAVALSGRTPELGSDQWCVSWKLHRPDGTPLPHEECPMAVALRERRPVRGEEAIAERPDGTRVWFEASPTPLFDDVGDLVGGINMLVDITGRRRTEQERARLSQRLAKELGDMERLHAMSVRLTRQDALDAVMREVLAAAAELVGADRASAQLSARGGGSMRLVSAIGFSDEFCGEFREVEADGFTTCAAALRNRARVIVEDLAAAPEFAELARAMAPYGIRAAMSTPLVATDGSLLGLFTTYWHRPHRPTEHELRLLELYIQQAARHVERREADEALRRSEEKLRLVLETDAVAVLFFDHQGTLIGANEVFLRMTGYRREQIDRRELTWRTMTPPEWIGASVKQMEQFVRTGRIGPYEKEYFLADGTRRWMLFAGRDLGDGTIAEFCIDIAEAKRREADARVLSALGSEVITADEPQVIYEKVMEAAASLMRSQFASLQLFHAGRGPAGELQLLAQRGFDPESTGFWEWVGGGSTCSCGLALRCGTRVVIADAARSERLDEVQKSAYRRAGIGAVQSTPLVSRNGKLLGMISTHWDRPHLPTDSELSNFDILARQAADIIERSHAERALRQSETELRRHRDHLQELVDERTREVVDTHERLRHAERMASIGTLAAGLGHDMGNLLVPVRVRLESLAAMGLPDEAKEELGGLESSAEYLRKLASGLRLLAVDPARTATDEPTELRDWWTEAEGVLRSILPRGVSLESRMPEEECWIAMSKTRLTQSVFNLVQNAGDAMKDGPPGVVRVFAESEDGAVRLSVADNGPGMSDEVKRRCMEPFYTTKTRGISTGLGLSLVYGLVQEAGGRTELRSTLGAGTTFVLRLRGVAPPASAAAQPPAGLAVVDVKDARIRAIIAAELKSLRFAVHFDRDRLGSADLAVADHGNWNGEAKGALVALTSREQAPGAAIALGEKPTVRSVRDAVRQVARGVSRHDRTE